MVISLIPSSAATCLLSRPAYQLQTWRSRGVSAHSTLVALAVRRPRAGLQIAFDRHGDSVQNSWSRNGLVRNSTAPAFIARTDMGISPWPVMKTMGTSL